MYHTWSRTSVSVCINFSTSLRPRDSKEMALLRYMRPKEGLPDLLGVYRSAEYLRFPVAVH